MRTRRNFAAVGAVVLIATGLAACGSSGGQRPNPAADQAAVRGALTHFEQATQARDYRGLCNRVLARELVHKVASAGLPCEVAMRVGLKGVRQPHLQVSRIKVSGNHALAEVYSGATGEKPSTDVVQLVREQGGWRVMSLAGPEPPAPRRASALER
jgi:hypothetical protein